MGFSRYASNFLGTVLHDYWAVSDDQGLVGKPTSYIIRFFSKKTFFFATEKNPNEKSVLGENPKIPYDPPHLLPGFDLDLWIRRLVPGGSYTFFPPSRY